MKVLPSSNPVRFPPHPELPLIATLKMETVCLRNVGIHLRVYTAPKPVTSSMDPVCVWKALRHGGLLRGELRKYVKLITVKKLLQ
jgi:hypothetical protein